MAMAMPNTAHAGAPRLRHATAVARSAGIAAAYDHAGDAYGRYADGDGAEEPAAANRFAHADAIVWRAICAAIDELVAAGVSRLRVLDAGCGPGTWIVRIAARAHRLGLSVEAVGFDIATGQLAVAQKKAERLRAGIADDRLELAFLCHDLCQVLPWCDGNFHIVLCNYVVLNHLPKRVVSGAIAELCRVSRFCVIATVRAIAGPPTGCIIGLEQLRDYRKDCRRGQLTLRLKDGSEHRLTFNLYSAETLKALFAVRAGSVDLRAIDLFLSRFAPDANWSSKLVTALPGRKDVVRKLKDLEEALCRQPGWIDHGSHILIVAEPKR
jgi:SAM-dependent methyltransferase